MERSKDPRARPTKVLGPAGMGGWGVSGQRVGVRRETLASLDGPAGWDGLAGSGLSRQVTREQGKQLTRPAGQHQGLEGGALPKTTGIIRQNTPSRHSPTTIGTAWSRPTAACPRRTRSSRGDQSARGSVVWEWGIGGGQDAVSGTACMPLAALPERLQPHCWRRPSCRPALQPLQCTY